MALGAAADNDATQSDVGPELVHGAHGSGEIQARAKASARRVKTIRRSGVLSIFWSSGEREKITGQDILGLHQFDPCALACLERAGRSGTVTVAGP